MKCSFARPLFDACTYTLLTCFSAMPSAGTSSVDASLAAILSGNLCGHIGLTAAKQAECETFEDGLLKRGLTTALNTLQTKARSFLQQRLSVTGMRLDGTAILPGGDTYKVGSILDSDEYKRLSKLETDYVEPCLSLIAQMYASAGIDNIAYLRTVLILAAVACVAAIVLFNIVVFNPYLHEMDRSIRHTRATLLLLPEQVIRRVPAIKSLLQSPEMIHAADSASAFCCAPQQSLETALLASRK